MIYKQHREIETSLSLGLCCSFSYSKISKRLEGVAYKLLLINYTACKPSLSRSPGDGCLQYFTGVTGTISSYNFAGAVLLDLLGS